VSMSLSLPERDHLTEDAQDALFQFGIDMCLRGVQALLKQDS
jgi:hypothetical protein